MLDYKILQFLFNNSPDGKFLFAPDPDPIILAVNEVALKAVSRRREDVVGKRLFDAFPGDPDDHQDTGVPPLRESLPK